MYWYGYDRRDEHAWAFADLRARTGTTTASCGDVMITTESGATQHGDLGAATTPGTGFGVVCDNSSSAAVSACTRLGKSLAQAYDDVPMPDGSCGRLDFTIHEAVTP